jgi:thioredoxin 2
LFTGRPTPVSARSFAIHIQHNDIPVVADFWAEWCGPCKVMAPVFERAAAEFEPELRFLKVDTEAEAEPSARYNTRSIPTLMLFHKGNVIAQRAGAVTAEALCQWLRQDAPSAAAAAS